MDTITTEIVKLAPLLQRAADTLINAKTSAKILDARDTAHSVWAAAQEAEHRARIAGAAQTVISACHKVQGEALKIEYQAKARLTEEYTAAQKRGEVQGHGGVRGNRYSSKIPDENLARNRKIPDENLETPALTDLGLTGKQVHEGRKILDAEAIEPGIIAKTIDAEVAAGQAPRKAEIAKAVNKVINKSKAQPQAKPNKSEKPPKVDKNHGSISNKKLVDTPDVPECVVRQGDIAIRYYQKGRNDALEELAAGKIENLPLTIKRKLEIHVRILTKEHEQRINQRMANLDEEVRLRAVERNKKLRAVLEEQRKKVIQEEKFVENSKKHYDKLINNHKPVFSETDFTSILRCLHADSRHSLSDERLNFAFTLLNSKKQVLIGKFK